MNSMRLLCASAALVLSVSPLFAATYVWNGAVSDRFSDPANWSGGSPATDPRAELSFPSTAVRKTLVNDLPDLTVRSIAFSATGYTISGGRITIANGSVNDATVGPNTIASALRVDGSVAFTTSGNVYSDAGLILTGAISGNGTVTKAGTGRLTFGGTAPNVYTGTTRVTGGDLLLMKPDSVTAVPGDLVIAGSTFIDAVVASMELEQIANEAAVRLEPFSNLRIARNERIGRLSIGPRAEVRMSGDRSGDIRMTGTLILGGDVEVLSANGRTEGAYVIGPVTLPATRTITLHPGAAQLLMGNISGQTLDTGLIVRGAGSIELVGGYAGQTIVDGAGLELKNPNSAVLVRAGRLGGEVRSATAEGGVVTSLVTPGALRLHAAAKAAFQLGNSSTQITASSVDLGGATLIYARDLGHTPGRVYTLIDNKGSAPVAGTFAGLPEGSMLENRFRLSYSGGTGNDVTMTDVSRYYSSVQLSVSGSSMRGRPMALAASVSSTQRVVPAGTVTFLEGATVLATVPLNAAGKAETTFVPSRTGVHELSARFDGNATTDPSTATLNRIVIAPPPVIQSIEPTSMTSGETITLIVRGTDFPEDAQLVVNSFGYRPDSRTDSELRLRWTAPKRTTNYNAPVFISTDTAPSISNVVQLPVAGVPATPSLLKFAERSIQGAVAPGASSAWLRGSRRPSGAGAFRETELAIVNDSDNDGSVTWTLANVLPASSLVAMVDISTGTLNVGKTDGTMPDPIAFPEAMFLRDPSGAYSHIATGTGFQTMLWVRPRVGAWSMQVTEGPPRDADPVLGILTSTAHMQPLTGSPAPPAGVEPGDVFVVFVEWDESWYGGRVDEHLGQGPGVLSHYAWSLTEGAPPRALTVIRRGGSDGVATVRYATVDGTAIGGVHFEPLAGTLTFGPGEVLKTIDLRPIDDAVYSGTTQLTLVLSDPAGTTISSPAEKTITIPDNDPRPVLTIGPAVAVQEGDSGTRTATMNVMLTGATRVPVPITWFVSGATVAEWTGQFVFAPGETRKTITVSYEANTITAPDRVLTVAVSTEAEVTSTIRSSTITIRDDDPLPVFTMLDASVSESAAVLRLAIPHAGGAIGRKPTVRYTTVSGSAIAGSDFIAQSGTVDLTRGGVIDLKTMFDTNPEGPEWFTVVLFDPVDATFTRMTAVVTILDDDASSQPVVSIGPASALEGDSGTAPMHFTVQLSAASQSPVTVSWRTADGTADRTDYGAGSGELVFAPGETAKTIAVSVFGDVRAETDETLSVQLTAASNAAIASASATGTIRDDDEGSRGRAVRH